MRKIFLVSFLTLFLCAGAAFAQQFETPKIARSGSFQIVESDGGKFYYVLKSSNGQEILKGYQFGSPEKVEDAIIKVKQSAAEEANYDPRNEKEQWYFFLKSSDGKAIGRSENYSSEAAMKRGLESVRKTAPYAAIK